MGKAGIVLGLEVSRLARNNADWHRLLEICALSDTLIFDEDGLYDPGDFNDRLLLGLKGTMSEAELHFLRARLPRRDLSKARRGELQMPLPVGLVYDPAGKVVLDPDQASSRRSAICSRPSNAPARRARSCRRSTARGCCSPPASASGSARASSSGCRCRTGACCAPCTTRAMPARSPMAGTAAARPPRARSASSAAARAVDALIPDAHPGYITWEQYENNQRTARRQRRTPTAATGPPARRAKARRCCKGSSSAAAAAERMTVRYHTRQRPGARLSMRAARTSRAPARSCQVSPARRRRRDRAAAARHRHPARARSRAHSPSRARGPRRRSRPAPPQPRRAGPPAGRARPSPIPRRRPRQQARRRHARSRLERRAARPPSSPRRIRATERRR